MWKVVLIVLVGAILIVGYSMFQDVDAIPGEANPEAALDVIVEVQDAIRDTAFDIKSAIDATGDGIEVETHDSPLPAFWEWAKALMERD